MARSRTRRQMPRIYGNLQTERHDWRGFWRSVKRVFWGVAILGLIYIIFFGPIFRVRSVDVQGAVLSNADQIKSTVPLGESIWNLPQNQIISDITKTQPVESVEISRGLPSTVAVILQEQEPIIGWSSAGVFSLIDTNGNAFLQYSTSSLPATNTPLGQKIASLFIVDDTQNLPVKIGEQVAGASFVQFMQTTLQNLHHYLPTYQWDHAEVGASLYDVTFVSKAGMHVEMNTLGDSGVETRNLTRLIQQGKTQPNSTVNLTIDRWAYVS